jgi:hypothetical protein
VYVVQTIEKLITAWQVFQIHLTAYFPKLPENIADKVNMKPFLFHIHHL